MKSQLNAVLIVLVGLSLGGCHTDQKRVLTESSAKFQLKQFEELKLKNGLNLIFIPDSGLPRVGYHFYSLAGSAQDPEGQEGTAGLVAALLDQGTRSKTATQIADEFSQLGSSVQVGASQDALSISTSGLSFYQKQLFDLVLDVMMNPVFREPDFKRVRSQVIAEITQAVDQPQSYADMWIEKQIFGSHPYAHPVEGTKESLLGLQAQQLRDFYAQKVRPDNSWFVVTGKFDEQLRAMIIERLEQWKKKESQQVNVDNLSLKSSAERFLLMHKKGLQQTQLRLGHFGVSRSHPDFLKIRAVNLVLGGAFASRLNQRIRDDLGLTYGISSHFESKVLSGSFEISTFTRNDKVAEVLKETMSVLQEFVDKGMTEKELAAAKALMIGQFPAAVETVDRLAFNLVILRMNGVSDRYLNNFAENVRAIELTEVNRVIKQFVRPSELKLVLFADRSAIEDQLVKGQELFGPFKLQEAK